MSMLTGATIKFTALFLGFNDVAEDQDEVIFTLYDSKYTKITETTLTVSNKTATGDYFYLYVISTKGSYIYEFKGTKNTVVSLKRTRFEVAFYNQE